MLSLLIFTIFMTLILFWLKRKYMEYQKILTVFGVLFAVISLPLSAISLHQHRNMLWSTMQTWIKHDHPVIQHAFADTISKKEEREYPSQPLIELFQLKKSVFLKAPLISQYPELPRGCEVTSLAMLMQYHDIQADKMTLAKEIKKDETPYQIKGNKIYFGHPNEGFVGNMYSLNEPGYGVYHKPLAELAEEYAGERAKDLTGGSFYEILAALNRGEPVLVITNVTFKKLPESAFMTWHTDKGAIKITMKEHAVLVTGYDRDHIYFNDPIDGKAKKAPFDDFVDAWVQMGKQAITLTNG